MDRHHSCFGHRASVLAVVSTVLWAMGSLAGCSDDSGSGLGDAGTDGGADARGDADVTSDARPDGMVEDAGFLRCVIGEAIDDDCLCNGEVAVSGWCCDWGHQDRPCSAEHCSSYLVDVHIPPYDSNDPQHVLISTEEDWSHINDPDKRVFFVQPNTVTADVTITASGSESSPRILALYRDDDTHPGKLSPEEQAKVHLVFSGASHWIVDRLSSLNDTEQNNAVRVGPACQDLVFNRMNITDFHRAFLIQGSPDSDTRDITIQQCRMDTMRPEAIDGDNVAILVSGTPWDEPRTVTNVHILENEIRNANDGVMPLRHPDQADGHPVNYPGLVVDCNHIYVDEAVYTDGDGNPDPQSDAEWALTENAVDIKGGSDDPNNPMIVSNNVFWGYRHTDQNGGGSGSWGAAVVIHYDVKNLIVEGNVIFDSNRGIGIGDPGGLDYASEHVVIQDNILYDIGKMSDRDNYALYAHSSLDVLFARNTVVAGPDGFVTHWIATSGDTSSEIIRCNVAVSMDPMSGSRADDLVVEDNYHYATERREDTDGPYYPEASAAKLEDLTFQTDVYSSSPRVMTLPSVLTTAESPHSDWCQDQ
ncbi:MAG: hypothetical protein J7M25_13585 [Deltaproteobacteria bacterium]|nr:hypothetical protein [Deltaproteobacteria bacterium]